MTKREMADKVLSMIPFVVESSQDALREAARALAAEPETERPKPPVSLADQILSVALLAHSPTTPEPFRPKLIAAAETLSGLVEKKA